MYVAMDALFVILINPFTSNSYMEMEKSSNARHSSRVLLTDISQKVGRYVLGDLRFDPQGK